MKKMILWIVTGIILVIMIVGYIFWQMMMAPVYNPGDVKAGKHLGASLEPPIQDNQVSSWKVEDGIELKYFSKGKGRKVLVIHGGPGIPYTEAWPGLDTLTDEYEFFYYDQRGAGESTRPISKFDSSNYINNVNDLESALGLTAQIADIERIRRILKEDKLIIIGHSFGGLLASLYAAEFPQNVESMILVAPAPLLKLPMDIPDLFSSIKKRLPQHEVAGYDDFLKRYFDFKNVFNRTEDELIKLNEELSKYFLMALTESNVKFPSYGKPGGWMVSAMYLSMGRKHDYTEAVSRVKVPTLIIHTGNDIVQSEEGSKTYQDVYPHAEYKVMEDAGHMAFYDTPDQFGQIVREFMQ